MIAIRSLSLSLAKSLRAFTENKRWIPCAVLLGLAGFSALAAQISPATKPPSAKTPASGWVTVRPQESDALLPVPGGGWETFHRTRLADRHLPDWIPSTIEYARWGWRVFEPRPGKIDYAFLDEEIRKAQAAGQQLAFRVMCCSTTPGRPYHPDWLKQIGGRVVRCRYQTTEGLEVPDLDDPVVLERHLDLIRRLGERYDGHPGLAHVDLGSVGWWGEWHMSHTQGLGMPTPETQRRIVDAYLRAFRQTPLIMLIGGGDLLKYALAHGAGWRADCLGDMGGFSSGWCHMRDYYVQALTKAEGFDAWLRAPVAFETCWDMRKWVNEDWSLRYIFNYALAMHASVLNNKSAPLPAGPQVEAELRRFLRRLGGRYVLRQLTHPPTATPGALLPLNSEWQNVGSAPCYRPARLAWRLTDRAGQSHLWLSPTDVRSWLPGEVDLTDPRFLKNPPELPLGPRVRVADRFQLPRELTSGRARLEVAIVDPNTRQPLYHPAIVGPENKGWIAVSTLEITPP